MTVFILLTSDVLFSQKVSVNFSAVDSFVTTVTYRKGLDDLTRKLTDPYQGELFKARAIFKWITDNIRYDYKYYNKYYYKGKEPKTYNCTEGKNCEARRIVWEMKYIDRVLKKKKAVCYGYSILFQKMCAIAGLKSEIIRGYVRTEYYQVGSSGTNDHAWNAVWLDSAWYLLDATWAAGGCAKDDNGKLLPFQQSYDDYYWLTPAADFARNHYPENNKWVLLSNYSKETFSANPFYDPNEISKIELIMPASGIITAKKGDTIQFKIDYDREFNDLQINSNIYRNPDIWVWDKISKRKRVQKLDSLAFRKQQYIKFERTGTVYKFEYIVPDNALYYLDILFGHQRVIRFKVNVRK